MNDKLEQAIKNMTILTEDLKTSNLRHKDSNNRFQSWLDGNRPARSSASIPPGPLEFSVLGKGER